MDLWRLKVFRAVVEQGSFSKAARSIHLSQPTVSSHIKDMETHYGCRLLDRFEKKVAPTRAGEVLYQYAGRLLAMHDEAEAALAASQGVVRGELAVGGSTIPAGYLLPEVIGRFIRQYPDVRVCLKTGDTAQIIGDILSGSLELGVVGARSPDKRLIQRKIMDDELRVIIASDHQWAGRRRINMDELVREPFIIRERGSGTLMAIEAKLAESGLSSRGLNIVAELSSTEAVIQGVRHHIGISIVSLLAVREAEAAGMLKSLAVSGLTLTRQFYSIRRKGRTESPAGAAFRGLVEAAAGGEPADGEKD
ncbi:MAG: selenium metabolism-associated LysR family transcriptional regulator [Thermodesulfobacteriota bacterium]